MEIIKCQNCGSEFNFHKWYEQDAPDCVVCGYPIKAELHPELPKTSLINRIKSAFSPSKAISLPIYIYKLADVSVYNGTEQNIDFDLFFSKVNGVIARSSAGSSYFDPMFEVWKREANKRGVPFGQYHYFKPDKSIDSQASLVKQAYTGGTVNMYPDLDVEVNPFIGFVGDKQKMSDSIYQMLKRIDALLSPKFQEIYTSKGFWDSNVARNDFARNCLLHVAHWSNVVEPSLPNDWSAITNPVKETIWQKFLDVAAPYGLPSSKVDINYFRGTRDQFFTLFGIYPYENSVVPPPPNTWPIPTSPMKFKVLSAELNVRTGPGKQYPILEKINRDTIVYGHSVNAPTEAWIEIAPGKWVAFKHSGIKYLEEVE